MLKRYSPQIRRTAICVVTALAIALPGAASAGLRDKVKSRVQNTAAKAVAVATNIREQRPLARALQNAAQNAPGAGIIELVRELEVKEQFLNGKALIQEVQADYRYFSGGVTGCEAECKAFRAELKATFDDFLSLVEEVPVLENKPGLYENIARVADLIDFVPPRTLYLMWQALDAQMDELRMTADQIRALLATLPPVDVVSDIGVYAQMAGTYVADSPVCDWADQKKTPYVDLVQAELERIAWALKTVAGRIPGASISVKIGATAGIAVANGLAVAGVSFSATDFPKIGLKSVATVPEAINWAIKLNILRAKVVCDAAGRVAN